VSQRVLVTAAASGIGREIARAFYQGGAAVFVCDVDTSALSELERELRGVRTAMCDVGNRADVERMMVAGVAALGGLDVLVNNAGIAGPTATVEQYDPAAWDTVMRVNLTGTFASPSRGWWTPATSPRSRSSWRRTARRRSPGRYYRSTTIGSRHLDRRCD